MVEIRPVQGFYDYANKYTKGATEYLVPAPLTPAETAAVRSAALAAVKALELRVYSRVDILFGKEGPTVLEINTHSRHDRDESPAQGGRRFRTRFFRPLPQDSGTLLAARTAVA